MNVQCPVKICFQRLSTIVLGIPCWIRVDYYTQIMLSVYTHMQMHHMGHALCLTRRNIIPITNYWYTRKYYMWTLHCAGPPQIKYISGFQRWISHFSPRYVQDNRLKTLSNLNSYSNQLNFWEIERYFHTQYLLGHFVLLVSFGYA